MEVLRNWIAPVLTRALDEHLELSKRKKLNRIHVEEDLSHLDVHCDSVQFVQLVEWQSTASDITAILADTRSSIHAVFPLAFCYLRSQNLSTSSLLDLKPGSVFSLSHPEVRISDCFDPVKIELWVKDFTVLEREGLHLQEEQLVHVNTLPEIRDRLRRFTTQRTGDNMANLGTKAAIDSSPGFKSQVSAEEQSDFENGGDALVSQSNFATQVPFTSPKCPEKTSTGQTHLLGKRKAMTDLRQLLNDSSTAPKKNKLCSEDQAGAKAESSVPNDLDGGNGMKISSTSAVKSEPQPKNQDIRSDTDGIGTPPQQKASQQGLDAAEDDIPSRRSPSLGICNSSTEIRLPGMETQLRSLAKWLDGFSKSTYLPRYIQNITKAQSELLAADDKWQPALVGHPTRPGTLPLDILNRLTAAVDQKAVVGYEQAPSNLEVSTVLSHVAEGEAGSVQEPELPSNAMISKPVLQTHDLSSNEAQEAESDSDDTSASWSSSLPQLLQLHGRLPLDSSPLETPSNMSVPVPPTEAPPHLIRKPKDSMMSGPIELPSSQYAPAPSQQSRHHSNNTEDSCCTHGMTVRTSMSIQEKSVSRSPSVAIGGSTSPRAAKSACCSGAKSKSAEGAKSVLGHGGIVSSLEQCDERNGLENIRLIQESDGLQIVRQPTSTAPQQPLGESTEHSSDTSQKQPRSHRLPPAPSSQQLNHGTLQHGTTGPWLTRNLQGSQKPKESIEGSDIDASENASVPSGSEVRRVAGQEEQDNEITSGQAMKEIHSASEVSPIVSRDFTGVVNGTITYASHSDCKSGIALEDTIMTASEVDASDNYRQDIRDKNGFPQHSQPTKSTSTSSLLGISGKAPKSRQGNHVTRQHCGAVTSIFRKTDAASPLPPSKAAAISVSSTPGSVQSGDRGNSAKTSILRPPTAWTPITSLSTQAQKVSREFPASISEVSSRSSLRPENQFHVFNQHYPTYGGTFDQFLLSCRIIKKIRTEGKLLPQGVWDDFVYRHNHDYRSYLDDIAQSSIPEAPMLYPEFYADCVTEPLHLKGVLKLAFIDALRTDINSPVTPDITPSRTVSETNHLPPDRRSIAASSSASNIHVQETLVDRAERMTAKDTSMTLESQLQLKEREEAPESHATSVHLWLQKASGMAPPKLGNPDELAAAGNVSRAHLTQSEEEIGRYLLKELRTLRTQYADTCKVSRRDDGHTITLPNAKTEPFKHFMVGQAKLDVNQYGTSQIQTDVKATLLPRVQRTVDIFLWNG